MIPDLALGGYRPRASRIGESPRNNRTRTRENLIVYTAVGIRTKTEQSFPTLHSGDRAYFFSRAQANQPRHAPTNLAVWAQGKRFRSL